MSYTNSAINPISNLSIPVDPYYYCHVFFGLVEWYLDKTGVQFDDVFEIITAMEVTLPEQKIDFDVVEEAFELYRDDVEGFEVVESLLQAPLSLDHRGTVLFESSEKQSKLPPDLSPEWEYDYDENWIQWYESYETE